MAKAIPTLLRRIPVQVATKVSAYRRAGVKFSLSIPANGDLLEPLTHDTAVQCLLTNACPHDIVDPPRDDAEPVMLDFVDRSSGRSGAFERGSAGKADRDATCAAHERESSISRMRKAPPG